MDKDKAAEHAVAEVRINQINGRRQAGVADVVTTLCSCGWESVECASETQARKEHDTHITTEVARG